MNVLLISFQQDPDVIGLKIIHYVLLDRGHESTLLFLPEVDPKKQNEQVLIDFVKTLSPGLIGISLMSHEFYQAKNCVHALKKHLPKIPIVLGGIHPTLNPEDCLKTGADFVCIGEGEIAIKALTDALEHNLPTHDIKNLCRINQNGELHKNDLNDLIQDLDSIPHYDHIPKNGFIYKKNAIHPLTKSRFNSFHRYAGSHYAVLSSRGCPFKCTYCCNNFLSDLYGTSKIRRRSIDNIIAELSKAIRDNPDIEHINFADDCFLATNIAYIEKFAEAYKKHINRPFIFRSIPSYITKEKLECLKDVGLSWVLMGLQSGSDYVVSEVYHRKSLKKHFIKAANSINEIGVAVCYDIIMDNPYETDDDIILTCETLIDMPKPFYLELFALIFYYGTDLYNRAKQDKLIVGDEYLKIQEYREFKKRSVNSLVRLSAFLPRTLAKNLVDDFKKSGDSPRFRRKLMAFKLFSVTFCEPVVYFWLLLRSRQGSIMGAIGVIPTFVKAGLRRIVYSW